MDTKNLNDYKDHYGFIGQKNDDGLEFGDSTQRIGQEAIAQYITEPLMRKHNGEEFAHKVLMIRAYDTKYEKVSYVRHWDNTQWPGQRWIMSRDNLDPIWKALALYAPHSPACRSLFKEMSFVLVKRGGFTWNWKHIWPKENQEPKLPDFIAPWEIASMMIRGFRLWFLWPLLLVLDLPLVVNSLLRVLSGWTDPEHTSDDLNHQGRLVFSQVLYWTPVAWISKYIYTLLRPNPRDRDTPSRREGYPPLEVYKGYYRHPEAPPMYDVWGPVIERYL